MMHDDMLDVKDMLDDWMSKYLGRPVVNWPKRDPYLNYVEQGPISTENLRNILNKEKENEPMETKHRLMNTFKKGMLVNCPYPTTRGYIEAFDYAHFLVGVRPEGTPSYEKLKWIDPELLTIITIPDGNEVQTLNGPCPKPKKVVYNEEAGVMVVIWMDGQKTIVRPTEDEDMNPYDAFCAAYCKRIFGSNNALKRELKKVMVIEKPKTKKNATTQMPTSELGKAIKDFKEKLTEAMTMNKSDPNYDN